MRRVNLYMLLWIDILPPNNTQSYELLLNLKTRVQDNFGSQSGLGRCCADRNVRWSSY
jgi:hypothetical protein